MRIGNLRHRVTIQEATVTRNERGAEVLAWTDLDTVWGEVRSPSGTETVAGGEHEVAMIQHLIKIRYYGSVTPKHRIKWGDRYFSVLAPLDMDNRMRATTLACREIFDEAEVA